MISVIQRTIILSKKITFFSDDTHLRGGSRTAATFKLELFLITVNGLPAVNYYHKELHLECYSSPRSASASIVTLLSEDSWAISIL